MLTKHLVQVSCSLRSLFVGAIMGVSLMSCAQLPEGAPEQEISRDSSKAEPVGAASYSREKLLIPWQTITGGRLITQLDASGFPVPGALEGFTALISPSALAVRGSDLYIADSGARKLYRFDYTLQAMSVVPSVAVMPWTRLQVGVDQSLFVLDAGNSTIRHFTRNGQLLSTFTDPLATSRLTDFVVDESLGKIIATDGLNQRLVELHVPGSNARVIDSSGLREFTALGALASAGRNFYALDMGCSCIIVLDEDGRVLERIGQGMLKQPRALVVDRQGQIFVTDSIGRTLKIFQRGALVATYGAQALGVTELSALAVDEGTLYIADAAGSRVVAFRIGAARH